MSASSHIAPAIRIEVSNKPLPVRMRLASLRARPGLLPTRRRKLPGFAPVLPVIGLAGLALTLRRGR